MKYAIEVAAVREFAGEVEKVHNDAEATTFAVYIKADGIAFHLSDIGARADAEYWAKALADHMGVPLEIAPFAPAVDVDTIDHMAMWEAYLDLPDRPYMEKNGAVAARDAVAYLTPLVCALWQDIDDDAEAFDWEFIPRFLAYCVDPETLQVLPDYRERFEAAKERGDM